MGAEYWNAKEKDHHKYDEPSVLSRVSGIPKRITYIGFTKMKENYTFSARLVVNGDIYNKTHNRSETKNKFNSNITTPFWGGDLVFDISGELDHSDTLKSIMLYRTYF